MKTNLFTLALLLISAASFAQTNLLTEFPTIMKARNADPKGWLDAHTTPDMTFIAGHDGSLQNKEWMMGLFAQQKSQTSEVTNLKVKQAADLAVATGISTIKAVGNDGSDHVYNDAFTYTFRWLGEKWMITDVQHTMIEYK